MTVCLPDLISIRISANSATSPQPQPPSTGSMMPMATMMVMMAAVVLSVTAMFAMSRIIAARRSVSITHVLTLLSTPMPARLGSRPALAPTMAALTPMRRSSATSSATCSSETLSKGIQVRCIRSHRALASSDTRSSELCDELFQLLVDLLLGCSFLIVSALLERKTRSEPVVVLPHRIRQRNTLFLADSVKHDEVFTVIILRTPVPPS